MDPRGGVNPLRGIDLTGRKAGGPAARGIKEPKGMTEGQGVTAASAPEEGVRAGSVAPAPAADPVTSSSSANLPAAPPEVEPYVRVDGRKIEAALLALPHLIVEGPLHLAAPGVDEARTE